MGDGAKSFGGDSAGRAEKEGVGLRLKHGKGVEKDLIRACSENRRGQKRR